MTTQPDEMAELVAELAKLGDIRLYRGPRHPSDPRPEIAEQITAYLAARPYLARDPEYVWFLEAYAGLYVFRVGEWFSVNIYGFDPEDFPDLSRKAAQIADHPGFDSFADITYKLAPELPGPPSLSFAFSKTDPGVFRAVGEAPYQWYCDGFLTWLRDVVETRAFQDAAT